MAIDLEGMDLSTLVNLAQQINEAIWQKQQDEQTAEVNRKAAITASIADLDDLLGEEGADPGIDSIRGVLAYDDATIEANAGLAFRLILLGMEKLTDTVLDIARVIGE